QGEDPQMYAGNISYYLEKSEQQQAANKATTAASSKPNNAGGNRKEQRKLEAAARKKRNDVLKPLHSELSTLEQQIAEFEAAQAALTTHMSAPETAADADKMQQATSAYQALSEKLENTFSRWGEVSDAIEKAEAELGSLPSGE
ncbi:MAG: ABC transporter C-terminal domain-containing protein, partial [Akkermansiaceae bacterium]